MADVTHGPPTTQRSARGRLDTASRHVDGFGVATECGFGRRPPETVAPLLGLHREVAGVLP